MFIINWLFDKLGYMPKIDFEPGKVDLSVQEVWPFPTPTEAKKVIVPKATTKTKKPAVVAKKVAAKKTAKRK